MDKYMGNEDGRCLNGGMACEKFASDIWQELTTIRTCIDPDQSILLQIILILAISMCGCGCRCGCGCGRRRGRGLLTVLVLVLVLISSLLLLPSSRNNFS